MPNHAGELRKVIMATATDKESLSVAVAITTFRTTRIEAEKRALAGQQIAKRWTEGLQSSCKVAVGCCKKSRRQDGIFG